MKDNDLYNLIFELGIYDCQHGISHGKKSEYDFIQKAYDAGYGHAYEVEQIANARFEQSFGEIFK